jgi:hypothetical protein
VAWHACATWLPAQTLLAHGMSIDACLTSYEPHASVRGALGLSLGSGPLPGPITILEWAVLFAGAVAMTATAGGVDACVVSNGNGPDEGAAPASTGSAAAPVSLLKAVLGCGPSNVNANSGRALQWAAQLLRADFVAALVSSGADVRVPRSPTAGSGTGAGADLLAWATDAKQCPVTSGVLAALLKGVKKAEGSGPNPPPPTLASILVPGSNGVSSDAAEDASDRSSSTPRVAGTAAAAAAAAARGAMASASQGSGAPPPPRMLRFMGREVLQPESVMPHGARQARLPDASGPASGACASGGAGAGTPSLSATSSAANLARINVGGAGAVQGTGSWQQGVPAQGRQQAAPSVAASVASLTQTPRDTPTKAMPAPMIFVTNSERASELASVRRLFSLI